MWEYIVTWCLVFITWDTSLPKKDEFDRPYQSRIEWSIEQDCGHYKKFYWRHEAIDFYKRAVESSIDTTNLLENMTQEFMYGNHPKSIINVEIDSVKIND